MEQELRGGIIKYNDICSCDKRKIVATTGADLNHLVINSSKIYFMIF